MMLGMDDWLVSAAYLANIGAMVVCVVYGAINYNRGDDTVNSDKGDR